MVAVTIAIDLKRIYNHVMHKRFKVLLGVGVVLLSSLFGLLSAKDVKAAYDLTAIMNSTIFGFQNANWQNRTSLDNLTGIRCSNSTTSGYVNVRADFIIVATTDGTPLSPYPHLFGGALSEVSSIIKTPLINSQATNSVR
ncbi:MAG: hypothetical protein LBD23_04545 [Oscillospiraceae bacterium]|nr:hypothetical protein [Oscillospiraceae bacterium]